MGHPLLVFAQRGEEYEHRQQPYTDLVIFGSHVCNCLFILPHILIQKTHARQISNAN